jgi:hypothetical protein
MWSHQVTGLWVVFVSFCPQGKLQLGTEVTYQQFMQGGQNCCFHQAAAALPYSCNSVCSAPPARWGNSVSSIALCPTWPAPGCTTCPALGGWLFVPPPLLPLSPLPIPCSQPLWLSWPLLSVSGSSGRLACSHNPFVAFSCVCSLSVQHWEFSSLPHPHSLG